MLLWLAGFKWADASIAAVLNQTTVFFSMALATFVLKEHFGARKAAATVLAVSGVLLATFSR
jgi:drug/metabolite transporter (DMT)-like permease